MAAPYAAPLFSLHGAYSDNSSSSDGDPPPRGGGGSGDHAPAMSPRRQSSDNDATMPHDTQPPAPEWQLQLQHQHQNSPPPPLPPSPPLPQQNQLLQQKKQQHHQHYQNQRSPSSGQQPQFKHAQGPTCQATSGTRAPTHPHIIPPTRRTKADAGLQPRCTEPTISTTVCCTQLKPI